ncbi:MAG: FkbM family methyltransferase [Verrucomicrobiales bacterium]|nr:FkbM family methyltransferase [Verrucomicrobiales bacterium]
MRLLRKIPFVRGVIAKWENRRAMRKLLSNYENQVDLIRSTPIKSISFQERACIYELEDGRKFAFRPDKTAGLLYSVPFAGNFEAKETAYIKNTLGKDWVCLDVGGCFGWYTSLFSQIVGESGAVHVFEPVPDNRECLQQTLELNNCKNVAVHNFALGNSCSSETIYVPDRGVSGSLRVPKGARKVRSFEVKVRTLDDFSLTDTISRVDFIKADIEGAELMFIQGGIDVLNRFRPILLLEVQAHSTRTFGYEPRDLFLLMKSLDYVAHWVDQSGDLVCCDDVTSEGVSLPDYNFVFIPGVRSGGASL